MDNFYQISEFARLVGKHVNTVDNWFKSLEEKRLHYVNRVAGAKVYDGLDLQIALFIRDKRNEKWAMDGIFDILPQQFELRPFPVDEATSVTQMLDMDAVMSEVRKAAEQLAAAQVEEMRRKYDDLVKLIPGPVDPRVEKQRRIDDMITQRRVMMQLEEEALHMWSTKPREERLKTVGLFRKMEDIDKRDRFVRQYINEHFEERLRREYGLDS